MQTDMANDSQTPSVQGAQHPWRLLRKPAFLCRSPRAVDTSVVDSPAVLRLVVHGRSGGEIPACLVDFAQELAIQRQGPVELEALTAEPLPTQPGCRYWLMPLLLLPGSHARSDLPQIRERMRRAGADVTMVPFLGAWPQWWDLLRGWIAAGKADGQSVVVVHHPLRPGLSSRYLTLLGAQLGCGLVSADTWEEHARQHPSACPLPLALAPNRMAEALRQAGGLPSLLDDPQLRSGLISLLSLLP